MLTASPLREKTQIIPPQRRHIVISVDDEPNILSSLRRAFHNQAFDFRVTLSPDQALQWVQDEEVSLVITDERMPVTRGISLLQKICEANPRTLCMMLTAYPSPDLTRQAERLGVRVVVTKPWDDAELRRWVRQLLRERELTHES